MIFEGPGPKLEPKSAPKWLPRRPKRPLGASWRRLGASWGRLGASWGRLGLSWGPFAFKGLHARRGSLLIKAQRSAMNWSGPGPPPGPVATCETTHTHTVLSVFRICCKTRAKPHAPGPRVQGARGPGPVPGPSPPSHISPHTSFPLSSQHGSQHDSRRGYKHLFANYQRWSTD